MKTTASLVVLSLVAGCAPRVWTVRAWRGGAVIGIQGSGRDAARLFADETRSVCGIREAEIIQRQHQSEATVCSVAMPQAVQSTTSVYYQGQMYTGHTVSGGFQTVPTTCREEWMEYTVRCVE